MLSSVEHKRITIISIIIQIQLKFVIKFRWPKALTFLQKIFKVLIYDYAVIK
jgi:hypothetical protein